MIEISISLNKFTQAKYLNDCLLSGQNKGENEFLVIIQDSKTYSNVCAPIAGIIDYYTKKGIRIKVISPVGSYARHVRVHAPLRIETARDVDFVAPFDKVWTFFTENDVGRIVDAYVLALREAAEIEKGVARSIEWCINEVLDNVLQHSNAEKGFVMAQMHKQNKSFGFSVFDSGIGIYNSLLESKHKPTSPLNAIELAMQERITRDERIGQGNGLWGFSQIIKETNGRLIIGSCGAKYSYQYGRENRVAGGDFNLGKELGTTVVDFQMDYSRPIDVVKALNGHQLLDLWMEQHETNKGEIILNIAKEATGTGTRKSAEKLRNIIINFIKEGYSTIILDFSSVGIVSSSFADEMIGKLMALLGFLKFMQYIVIKNTNDFNEAVINRSVGQRMAQIFMEETINEEDD